MCFFVVESKRFAYNTGTGIGKNRRNCMSKKALLVVLVLLVAMTASVYAASMGSMPVCRIWKKMIHLPMYLVFAVSSSSATIWEYPPTHWFSPHGKTIMVILRTS